MNDNQQSNTPLSAAPLYAYQPQDGQPPIKKSSRHIGLKIYFIIASVITALLLVAPVIVNASIGSDLTGTDTMRYLGVVILALYTGFFAGALSVITLVIVLISLARKVVKTASMVVLASIASFVAIIGVYQGGGVVTSYVHIQQQMMELNQSTTRLDEQMDQFNFEVQRMDQDSSRSRIDF